MYKLTEYITEKTVGEILRAWAGDENVTPQARVTGTRMRHDYEVRKGGKTYIIEYNGDQHYRDPNVILRDLAKADISKRMGKIVVEIPYFIQLTTETFKVFFGEKFEIETTFPHGFIASKMLPSSFCPIGYNRAVIELGLMPPKVVSDVMKSLEEKAALLGDNWTYFRNSVNIAEGENEISWKEFVDRSNVVHNNAYTYVHPL